jgi:hypothetical protein
MSKADRTVVRRHSSRVGSRKRGDSCVILIEARPRGRANGATFGCGAFPDVALCTPRAIENPLHTSVIQHQLSSGLRLLSVTLDRPGRSRHSSKGSLVSCGSAVRQTKGRRSRILIRLQRRLGAEARVSSAVDFFRRRASKCYVIADAETHHREPC